MRHTGARVGDAETSLGRRERLHFGSSLTMFVAAGGRWRFKLLAGKGWKRGWFC